MYVQMNMDGCDFVMMLPSYGPGACNPRFKITALMKCHFKKDDHVHDSRNREVDGMRVAIIFDMGWSWAKLARLNGERRHDA